MRGEKIIWIIVSVGWNKIEEKNKIGIMNILGRIEELEIKRDGEINIRRRKMRGKGVRKEKNGRKMRKERDGKKYKERKVKKIERKGKKKMEGLGRFEIVEKLKEIMRKRIGVNVKIEEKRMGSKWVC